MTATEYVVLVDEQDRDIGIAEKLSAHKKNLMHRAFSVFIFREKPKLELLLQQRAFTKYHSPGLWTNTCCSHPRSGEDIVEAAKRRLQEELGMTTDLKDLGWFRYNARFSNGLSENEIDHVLVGTILFDARITPDPKEVHAYRWIMMDDLQRELTVNPERFTPWLERALEMVRDKYQ